MNSVQASLNNLEPKDSFPDNLISRLFEICPLITCLFSLDCWTRFHVRMTIWTWQDTFDAMIICWMINYCAIALYIILSFVKEIIRIIRLQREHEWERLRQLELERELAAQPKPWQPKPKKKRRKKHDDW
ncbi:hypothetical protein OS493_029705 [Desmophyllum pertusum]|uniref:Uncharacterized protein n=1 Tax=Desmophyllum pertusum TaxID=174260 RepID=A0A9W9Z9B7_9CNID|nr:hypothetical protein OS493_029705 [Desmophyllum pertusum]